MISENDFLISNILVLDIRKWFFDIKNSIFDIKKINLIFWYQEFDFLISGNHLVISQIRILAYQKMIFWYKKNFWYQELCYDISRIIFWYKKNRIFDIKQSFSDIRKYLKNIKTAPHIKHSNHIGTPYLNWQKNLTGISMLAYDPSRDSNWFGCICMLDMLNLDRYVMAETASSTAVTVMKLWKTVQAFWSTTFKRYIFPSVGCLFYIFWEFNILFSLFFLYILHSLWIIIFFLKSVHFLLYI